jgi:hypothetical protein
VAIIGSSRHEIGFSAPRSALGHNRPIYPQVSSTATVTRSRALSVRFSTTKDISAAAIFSEDPLCRSPPGQSLKV